MEESSEKKPKKKKNLSEWILAYDKNAYCDPKIDEDDRELLIDSFNECSDLRKSFHDSLQNLFSHFGFSRTYDPHRLDKSFTATKYPKYELRKSYYYDGDLKLFKNNSVSKFDIKKKGFNKKIRNIKPQKKSINSLRKKMFPKGELFEDFHNDKKKEKTEQELYDLEIINKMIDKKEKEGNYGGEKKKEILTEKVIESENEDSEEKTNRKNRGIEKNDKLLNKIFTEIEKNNGKEIGNDNEEIINEYKNKISRNVKIEEKNSNSEKDLEKDGSFKSSITKANSSTRKSEVRVKKFFRTNEDVIDVEENESDKNNFSGGRNSYIKYKKNKNTYDKNNRSDINYEKNNFYVGKEEVLSPIRKEKYYKEEKIETNVYKKKNK